LACLKIQFRPESPYEGDSSLFHARRCPATLNLFTGTRATAFPSRAAFPGSVYADLQVGLADQRRKSSSVRRVKNARVSTSGGDLMYHDSNGHGDVPFAFSLPSPRQPAIIVTATRRRDIGLSLILPDKDALLSLPSGGEPFEQGRNQFWCIRPSISLAFPFRASRPRVARDFISFALITKPAVVPLLLLVITLADLRNVY